MKNIFKNKRTLILSVFIISMLSISLGYAYLRSKLSINGNTGIASNSWIIYFDNIIGKEDNIEAVNVATIDENKTKVSFDVDLEKAQDTYEFNVDIVNDGTIDAQIDKVIKSTLTLDQEKNLEYEITYDDGTKIQPCDTLPANSKRNILVKVRLREGEKYVLVEEETLNLSFEIDYVQYDESKECDLDENTYTLTIDPDGGEYNGSTNVVVIEGLKNGTKIVLEDKPIKEDYYFREWITYNDEDYTTDYEEEINTITIRNKNAYIKADYKLAIGPYSLTIDPNGGVYNGSTELIVIENLPSGRTIKLDTDPTLAGKLFKGWTAITSDVYTTSYNGANNSVTIVDKDAYLTAEYGDPVAQIVETDTYYGSLQKAFYESLPGQTIKLLADTTENPTNHKKTNRNGNTDTVTLDLDGNKVSGRLINNDILTIINGTIENATGIAVTNNGTLTMGVNDDTISKDSVGLIGMSTNGGVGLEQKGVFNFYDGYLEGYIGIDGIYNDIPSNHYAFVDHNDEKDCQKVYIIGKPDRAVAKSTNYNNSTMFYFNLQDAFNTSALAYANNKKELVVEAIRDFEVAYPLILPQEDNEQNAFTAFFDLKGHNVSLGYSLDNYGNLTIRDTGNEQTGEKGELRPSVTLENIGTLVIQNVKITQSNNTKILNNNGNLKIEKSILTAKNAYVMEIKSGEKMELDDETYLNSDDYALYVSTTSPFTISGGNIQGIYNAGNLTLDNLYSSDDINREHPLSSLKVTRSTSKNHAIYLYADYGKVNTLTINGGTVDARNTTEVYGIYSTGNGTKNIVINGGTIEVENTGTGYSELTSAIYSYSGNTNIEIFDGTVRAIGYGSSPDVNDYHYRGVWTIYSSNVTVHNGLIESLNRSTAADGAATTFMSSNVKIYDGTFNAIGKQAFLEEAVVSGGTLEIENGTFNIQGEKNAVIIGGHMVP